MFQPNQRIGPYILVRLLGQGGFGEVWLAEERGLITTQVALKLPLDPNPDLDAIRREAQTWLRASGHPNVLPVIKADIYNGQVVIVSEFASGGSLASWLKSHGGKAPSIEAAVAMTSGILAGLEHLHTLPTPIVHRDLKPDNVLLQGNAPRLTDFGISRVLKTTNRTQHSSGTPHYMPPEAFSGHYSPQSDLWAAGVMLYQMLSGKLPFPQTDLPALYGAIMSGRPNPLPGTIPAHLCNVVMSALDKEPSRRPKSASAMRALLNQNPAPPKPSPSPQQPAPPPVRPIPQMPDPITVTSPTPNIARPIPRRTLIVTLMIVMSGLCVFGWTIFGPKGEHKDHKSTKIAVKKPEAKLLDKLLSLEKGKGKEIQQGAYAAAHDQTKARVRLSDEALKSICIAQIKKVYKPELDSDEFQTTFKQQYGWEDYKTIFGKDWLGYIFIKAQNGSRDKATIPHKDALANAVTSPKDKVVTNLPSSSHPGDNKKPNSASRSAYPSTKTNPKDNAEMVLIPAGEFTMGSDDGRDNEKPAHKVTLSAYYIYKNDVTVAQYKKFCQATNRQMPPAPRFDPNWSKEDHPIVCVTWYDAKAYCDWAGVGLPTEAQWEKAARGPEGYKFPWGNEWDASKYANSVGSNKLSGTVSVGSYPANSYGLNDMAGNVWQWCADRYDENYYKSGPSQDPTGPATGSDRVLRGGCWGDTVGVDFRCAFRGGYQPVYGDGDIGFRCVASLDSM